MRSSESPRSVQGFLRFEDEEGGPAKKKTGNESSCRSPTSSTSAPSYGDQLPLGAPSHHFSLSRPQRNFVVRKPEPPKQALSPIRCSELLPLGSTPHYISAPPRRKLVGRASSPRSPGTSSKTTVSVRVTDQSPLSSPSQEDWNLVHQKPNRIPTATRSVLPPPPLVQATKATRHNQVTKHIRKIENATTRQSPNACATIIQSAFRRYLAHKRLEAKKLEYERLVPRIHAAVKIQMIVRACFGRMKFRIAFLEKQLEESESHKAYSLKWVEERKQAEMNRFLRESCEEAENKSSQITAVLTRTQKIIKDLRRANKKFRTQNKTLSEAIAIQTKRASEEEKKHENLLREIEKAEAEVAQSKREEKRLMASEGVYPKFVERFSQTLEEVNEYADVESKAKAAYKEVIANTIDLVKETCDDEDLVHTILEMGMTILLKDPKQMSETGQQEAAKESKSRHQREISETETSQTSGSDECHEDHFDLIIPEVSNFDCHTEILGSDDASTVSDEYEEISVDESIICEGQEGDTGSGTYEDEDGQQNVEPDANEERSFEEGSSADEISIDSESHEEIIEPGDDEEISVESSAFDDVSVN